MPFTVFHEPVLTSGQVERIANILDNAGQVLLASMVIAPLLAGIEKLELGVLILGLIGVLLFWTVSIHLARYKDL